METMNALSAHLLESRAKVFKALGHPARLRMVDELCRGERCVCELQKLVGSEMPTVSKHLSVLREAGVVEARRSGTNLYYSLKMNCVAGFLSCVENFTLERLKQQSSLLGPDGARESV